MTRTRVATSNLQAHMALFKVARSVRKVKRTQHPDLWGFQEIGGLHKWLTIRAVLGHRYAGARLKGDASATPVAWNRKRYRLECKFKWHLSDPTNVGRAGAGPKVLRGKAATVVVLWDRKLRKHVVLVNAHLAPSPWLNPARSELHSAQVQRLAELADRLRDAHPRADLYFVGDDNTTDRERLRPLQQRGLLLGHDVRTHGKHALDRIASNVPHRGLIAVSTDSDHDTLVGTF